MTTIPACQPPDASPGWYFVLRFDAAELLEFTKLLDRPPVVFAQAPLAVAEDRILWGSDWPHPNINKAVQRKMLVDYPHGLYGFAG